MGCSSFEIGKNGNLNKFLKNSKKLYVKGLSIINKQRKNVCKIINKKNNILGTGFFCKIQYSNKIKYIPVLITSHNILKKSDIISGKKIELIINDEKKIIKINEYRKMYISNKNNYNLTILEIKKYDGININNFLEIDDDFFNNENKNLYNNMPIYIIHFPHNLNIINSLAVIKYMNLYKIQIDYLLETDEESYGAPIINSQSYKVIGVYIKRNKYYDLNFGIIIKEPINEFIEKYYYKNQITFTLEINDINDYVFFFSKLYDCKELNDSNVKLYINDEKYKFKNYFYPLKPGKYVIKILFNFNLKSCKNMFYNCNYITNIDLSLFDSKNVVDMSYMFYGCENLENINLANLETQNVIDMNNMFSFCYKLTNIDLSSFDTGHVENMSNMFSFCYNLINLNLTSFDTKNVININNIFYCCYSITYIDISKFNTRNIIKMYNMFNSCYNLSFIDISTFKNKEINYIFFNCPNIVNIPYLKEV